MRYALVIIDDHPENDGTVLGALPVEWADLGPKAQIAADAVIDDPSSPGFVDFAEV